MLETPRTITDECRGLVYRTDFAKILQRLESDKAGVEVVAVSRPYSEYFKSGRNQPNKVIPVTTYVVSYPSCIFRFCEINTGLFSMKQNVVSMEGVGENYDVESRW